MICICVRFYRLFSFRSSAAYKKSMLIRAFTRIPNVATLRLLARSIGTSRLRLTRSISKLPSPVPGHVSVLAGDWHAPTSLCSSVKVGLAHIPSRSQCKEYHTAHTVGTSNELHAVNVKWSDGRTTAYPYVFLRDNCLCSQCYNPSSNSRILLMQDLDVDCKPSTVQLDQSGDAVSITWDDGHRSVYPLDWLAERSFPEEGKDVKPPRHDVNTKLWGAELEGSIPTFDFHELLTDDIILYQWLYKLQEIGFTLISGTPSEEGQLEAIGQRVAYLKPNTYGKIFTVKAKVNPSNLAYTTATLGCHTDLPYFSYTPGMQMLHCLEQAEMEGGDNILADGYYAAELLLQQFPTSHKVLSSTNVDFQDVGEDRMKYHMFDCKPVLSLDSKGNVHKVAYNNQVRASMLNVSVDKVEPLYRAMKRFNDIMHTRKNHVRHKLKSGEIICVDNFRVMHGRVAFKITEESGRHLEGGYIDWDELHSKFRVLAKQLAAEIMENQE